MWIVYLIVAALLWRWYLKHFYRFRIGTLNAFVGSNGTGKTFCAVRTVEKVFKRKLRGARIRNALTAALNVFRPKGKKKPARELPVLASNIPLDIPGYGLAYELKPAHLLLQEKLPRGSVILIDEVGQWCSQYGYNNPNATDNGPFDEFARLCRHYGEFTVVVTDQVASNIIFSLRRRLQTLHNMNGISFAPFPLPFYTARVRTISVNEDIKTVEEGMDGESARTVLGYAPFRRRYDTRAFSERYKTVPPFKGKRWRRRDLKTNTVIECPKERVYALTDNQPLPPDDVPRGRARRKGGRRGV